MYKNIFNGNKYLPCRPFLLNSYLLWQVLTKTPLLFLQPLHQHMTEMEIRRYFGVQTPADGKLKEKQ